MDKAFIKNPVEAYENLKAENYQLKKENEALKNNDVFSIRLFKDKADKYKQALTEIKDIAIEYTSKPDMDYFFAFDKVQQKISEVIDEQ